MLVGSDIWGLSSLLQGRGEEVWEPGGLGSPQLWESKWPDWVWGWSPGHLGSLPPLAAFSGVGSLVSGRQAAGGSWRGAAPAKTPVSWPPEQLRVCL